MAMSEDLAAAYTVDGITPPSETPEVDGSMRLRDILIRINQRKERLIIVFLLILIVLAGIGAGPWGAYLYMSPESAPEARNAAFTRAALISGGCGVAALTIAGVLFAYMKIMKLKELVLLGRIIQSKKSQIQIIALIEIPRTSETWTYSFVCKDEPPLRVDAEGRKMLQIIEKSKLYDYIVGKITGGVTTSLSVSAGLRTLALEAAAEEEKWTPEDAYIAAGVLRDARRKASRPAAAFLDALVRTSVLTPVEEPDLPPPSPSLLPTPPDPAARDRDFAKRLKILEKVKSDSLRRFVASTAVSPARYDAGEGEDEEDEDEEGKDFDGYPREREATRDPGGMGRRR